MDKIQIELLDQYWIDKNENNQTDFCSHGDIYLKINENEIINQNSGSWTVASTAVRLMKSALYGYDRKSDLPIISCCGYLLSLGCPNIISWDTKIVNDIIEISNIEVGEIKYGGKILSNDVYKIALQDYSKQILIFSRKVKRFYNENKPRIFEDNYYQEEFNEYWRQFILHFDALNKRNK